MLTGNMAKSRPLGISIFSVVFALYGIIGLAGFLLIVFNPLYHLSANHIGYLAYIIISFVLPLMAAGGLWVIKKWGWYVAVLAAISGLISSVLPFTGLVSSDAATIVIGAIVSVVMLYYLMTKKVRSIFGI